MNEDERAALFKRADYSLEWKSTDNWTGIKRDDLKALLALAKSETATDPYIKGHFTDRVNAGERPSVSGLMARLEARLANAESHAKRLIAAKLGNSAQVGLAEAEDLRAIIALAKPETDPKSAFMVASYQVGAWMSAALGDPKVCDAMKADIRHWFDVWPHLMPTPPEAPSCPGGGCPGPLHRRLCSNSPRDMKKYPSIWTMDELKALTRSVQAGVLQPDGTVVWVPARPTVFHGTWSRFRCAWEVFTGRADALIWPEGQ